MADSDKAYIGIKSCGCITFAMVAGYDTKREERAELKRQIKAGLRIEVTTAGEARARDGFLLSCPHQPRIEDVGAEVDRLVTAVPGQEELGADG
jgi:hypothetical protein